MNTEHLEDEENNLYNSKHLSCDVDTDGDGVMDCFDVCPDHSDRTHGRCGCAFLKAEPGVCGCDRWDHDVDHDGVYDCHDACPNDPLKSEPGKCGCGVNEIDRDWDGVPDCIDKCPLDAKKLDPGACGCGISDNGIVCWNGYAESLSYLIVIAAIFVLGYITGSLSLFGKRKNKQSILDRDFENNISPRNPKVSQPDLTAFDNFNHQSPAKSVSEIRQRQTPAPQSPIYNMVPQSPAMPPPSTMNPPVLAQPPTPQISNIYNSPIARNPRLNRTSSATSQFSDVGPSSPLILRKTPNVAQPPSSPFPSPQVPKISRGLF